MAHDHEHDHDHEHEDRLPSPAGLGQAHADTASRSLSDALSWSFKLLTVIMVFVAVGFFFTGVQQIRNNQVGIKKVFGKIVDGDVKPGLAITWPFPIGQIEVVSVKPQTLTIEDLWMNETPEDKLKSLSQRMPTGAGLRPGWDGTLYTGDKNLLHVKLECTYVIHNARKFKETVLPKFVYKDANREDLVVEPVRSTVVIAAIRTAAQWTADRIQDRSKDFLSEVQLGAQDCLDKLDCGIRIVNLTIPSEGMTRPLAVRPMYDAAQTARSQKDTLISTALSEANNKLNAACGGEARKLLLGSRALYGQDLSASMPATAEADDVGLIGRFNRARDMEERARLSGSAAAQKAASDQAEEILARIDEVLVRDTLGGEAFKIIADARTAVTAIKQSLEGRTKRFDELKTEYLKNPRFMLDSLWVQARHELLDDSKLIKYYVNTSTGKTVVTVSHDPDTIKELQRISQESSAGPGDVSAPPSGPPGTP